MEQRPHEVAPADGHDFHRARVQLLNLALAHMDSNALRCAVELGIPDAIHAHGGRITDPELLAALSIPPARAPCMRRLMRLLCHLSIFASEKRVDGDGIEYSLTALSRLLVTGHHACQTPYVIGYFTPAVPSAIRSMGDWFRNGAEPTPYHMAHGNSFWDMVREKPEYSKQFNESMAADSAAIMDIVIGEFGHVFDGITSLVDVGGSTGFVARAIAEAFPEIKCTVLDLPHVVDTALATEETPVDFVAGDMFEHIPHSNAVLLKACLVESASGGYYWRPCERERTLGMPRDRQRPQDEQGPLQHYPPLLHQRLHH